MGLSHQELDSPLDDIAFLARSNHRIQVLKALADGDMTRRELRESIDVSRATIGRILEGFQERGWTTTDGREYALTPFGRLLVEEFGDLMDTVETIQRLQGLAPKLPLEAMDFDLRILAEASVTTPTPTDATAHTRRERELLERSERVRFLCNQAQPETVELYRDWVVERERTLEAIIAGDAIDAASADGAMGTHLHEMVASDGATIYRYDGPVSVMLGQFDETASIVALDETGVPCAIIESDTEAVRAWVSDTIDAYREAAERVAVDDLAR